MCKVNSGSLFIKVFVELVLVICFHLVIFIIIIPARIVLTSISQSVHRQIDGTAGVLRTGSYLSNPEALAVICVRNGVISVGHLTTSISSVCRSQGARRVSHHTVARVNLRRLTVMLASSASSSSVASDKDRIPGTTSCKIFPTFAGLVFPNVPTKAA